MTPINELKLKLDAHRKLMKIAPLRVDKHWHSGVIYGLKVAIATLKSKKK